MMISGRPVEGQDLLRIHNRPRVVDDRPVGEGGGLRPPGQRRLLGHPRAGGHVLCLDLPPAAGVLPRPGHGLARVGGWAAKAGNGKRRHHDGVPQLRRGEPVVVAGDQGGGGCDDRDRRSRCGGRGAAALSRRAGRNRPIQRNVPSGAESMLPPSSKYEYIVSFSQRRP
jgi:hypothetical protein